MTTTVLFAGATGNTGVGAVTTYAEDNASKDVRILALTRSADSSSAKTLVKLPNVQVIEKDWKMCHAKWLRENSVSRIFIASHNGPTHFTDETLFLTAALEAGVEYIVRISTTDANIAPNTKVFYARAHWGIEAMLDTPEFAAMKWTSLRPNVFTMYFGMALQTWLKNYRETGKQTKLSMPIDRYVGCATINPYEIGIIAGKLLSLEDVSKHASKRHILVGPSDINGDDLRRLLEKHAGTSIDEVDYSDPSFFAPPPDFPEYLRESLERAIDVALIGKCSIKDTPTSPEVLELRAPEIHALDEIEGMLKEVEGKA